MYRMDYPNGTTRWYIDDGNCVSKPRSKEEYDKWCKDNKSIVNQPGTKIQLYSGIILTLKEYDEYEISWEHSRDCKIVM